jgi:hypothetical protein
LTCGRVIVVVERLRGCASGEAKQISSEDGPGKFFIA